MMIKNKETSTDPFQSLDLLYCFTRFKFKKILNSLLIFYTLLIIHHPVFRRGLNSAVNHQETLDAVLSEAVNWPKVFRCRLWQH